MNIKIKNYLGIASILGVLLVALSLWSFVRAYSQSIEPSSFRSFSATGEGEVVAVPDVATFTFSVISEGGANLSSLQAENVKKANAAIEFIKSQGIDSKDISTQSYSVEPRYEYSNCTDRFQVCPPPSIVGYTVRQSVFIKVRDFSKTGALLSGVVEKGANSVSSLQFEVDDPTALENEAREKAIAKAEQKAKSVARAAGFRLGRLLSIEEGNYPVPYFARENYGIGGASDAKAPAPSIEPGSQEVKVSVILRYEIR